MTETLPIRRCDGCGNQDTDPRFFYFQADGRELLFHNDTDRTYCIPPYIEDEFPDHPVIALRKTGLKGEKLREAVVEYVENSEDAR